MSGQLRANGFVEVEFPFRGNGRSFPRISAPGRMKAVVNRPHSNSDKSRASRFAWFENARPSRSVWTARGFSTAFGQGEAGTKA
jgi:hypothetical protein